MMKRLLFFFLLTLTLPSMSWGQELMARMNPYILGAGVSAAATSCGVSADVDMYNSDTSTWPIANGANVYYCGQGHWQDASDRIICKVVFKISKSAGDISGKTFTPRIWTDNSNDLGTNICSASGVTGNNSWSSTSLEIDFTNCTGGNCSASGCALSASTNYHFTMDMGGTDASNYASFVRTTTSTGTGTLNGWSSDKNDHYTGGYPNYDIQLKLHYYD